MGEDYEPSKKQRYFGNRTVLDYKKRISLFGGGFKGLTNAESFLK
jgi:hypothetical protein